MPNCNVTSGVKGQMAHRVHATSNRPRTYYYAFLFLRKLGSHLDIKVFEDVRIKTET